MASIAEWQDAINTEIKRIKRKWWRKGEKVVDRYRDERPNDNDNSKRFNMLWSNVETLKPALYSRSPKPEVSRRFKDQDPVGRQASMIVERALSYSLDDYDFDGEIKSCVEDYLLPGRATIRVRYNPTYGDSVTPRIELGMAVEGTGYIDGEGNLIPNDDERVQIDMQGPYMDGDTYQPVVYEEAECEYVYWQDFVVGPARRWKDVQWVAFAAYMDRDELVERFGEIGKIINLDHKPTDKEESEEMPKMECKAKIWEIWSKKDRKVFWISQSYPDDFLDVSDPPLNLHGFFPCPKPLYSVCTNNTMLPIPEYCMYQDQADEIDTLTYRISKLVPQIKVAGCYAGSEKETLGRLLTETIENDLIPVDDWAMHAERGGIQGMITWMPIEQVINTVIRLYEARDRTKQELYEITGLADIIRGASQAQETATAQRIKGQFATLRLSDRQSDLSKFIRDVLRLKAEVMCEHFEPQTLQMMTGLEVTPEVMQLLRNDAARGFRIDIETDSTLMADEEMDKQNRVQFLEATTGFMGQLMPMAEKSPALAPLFGELILFGVRGFKAGRQLEESIEQALEMLKQQAQQPQQQQPDPRAMEAQARAQKVQQDIQLDQAKFQQQAQLDQAKLQSEVQLDQAKLQHEMDMNRAEFGMKQQETQQDMELQRLKARLNGL